MVQKLPIGIQTFATIRQENYLYVDKTEAIYRLLTSGVYFFLSRPRRFGKSLTLSTIKAIFAGERNLFKGLWIEDRWDWTKIHPVIHVSFSNIGYKSLGLEAAIEAELRVIGARMGVQFEETGIARMFRELIEKLATTAKVVILIDEYDKPLIDYLQDKEQARAHQQILKSFYSVIKDSDPYIEFLLLTGVSKFSKVSIFSDLNNLKDITLHRDFAALTGYTQAEVEHYFGDAIVRLATERGQTLPDLLTEIRTWYNGYSWDGLTTLYNPFSFMSFIDSRDFRNFWFETGTPTFLLELMKENRLFKIDNLEVNEIYILEFKLDASAAVAINEADKTLLVGECKWTQRPIGTNILTDLQRKAQRLIGTEAGWQLQFALFAKSGFSPDLQQLAADQGVLLVTPDHLMQEL